MSLIQTSRLRFFGHMAKISDSQDMLKPYMRRAAGSPKRRPGRSQHTWLRTLEADLQPLNHGLNSNENLHKTEDGESSSWTRIRLSLGMLEIIMMM